jgi:hypothetical protein
MVLTVIVVSGCMRMSRPEQPVSVQGAIAVEALLNRSRTEIARPEFP